MSKRILFSKRSVSKTSDAKERGNPSTFEKELRLALIHARYRRLFDVSLLRSFVLDISYRNDRTGKNAFLSTLGCCTSMDCFFFVFFFEEKKRLRSFYVGKNGRIEPDPLVPDWLEEGRTQDNVPWKPVAPTIPPDPLRFRTRNGRSIEERTRQEGGIWNRTDEDPGSPDVRVREGRTAEGCGKGKPEDPFVNLSPPSRTIRSLAKDRNINGIPLGT